MNFVFFSLIFTVPNGERDADIQIDFRYSLFVKVPQPGDSEVTFSIFRSSCYLLLRV